MCIKPTVYRCRGFLSLCYGASKHTVAYMYLQKSVWWLGDLVYRQLNATVYISCYVVVCVCVCVCVFHSVQIRGVQDQVDSISEESWFQPQDRWVLNSDLTLVVCVCVHACM